MTEILNDINPIFIFKGTRIKPLSYGHKALILSLLDLQSPTFLDYAAAIYAATRTKAQLIKARANKQLWEAEVVAWIDKNEFGGKEDIEEAGKLIELLLEDTAKNAVTTANHDFSYDPDSGND